MYKQIAVAAVMTAVLAACGPRIQPVMANGEMIAPQSDDVVARARAHSDQIAEPQRVRLADLPPEQQAERLLREGDEYTAAGRLDLALQRYDQADVLRPDHAQTNLRIAQILDKQLRPLEAVMRYQMFVHQMELERLRAEGDVAANIAEAIARAHERIVVLERR